MLTMRSIEKRRKRVERVPWARSDRIAFLPLLADADKLLKSAALLEQFLGHATIADKIVFFLACRFMEAEELWKIFLFDSDRLRGTLSTVSDAAQAYIIAICAAVLCWRHGKARCNLRRRTVWKAGTD
jgi:hypothetical protein